jgi:A/G-specific adenine glycosylase
VTVAEGMSDLDVCTPDWVNEEESLQAFRDALKKWGTQNFRSFPWRLTRDPYRILIAELMLHRTQVIQVVPVYETFIERFPNLKSLSKASLTDLQSSLQSLGLHWRINLIYEMAQILHEKFGGVVPSEKLSLLSLPGVSDYVASAVLCFSWNVPEALIDTNTVRIIGRNFNWPTKDSSRRNNKFRQMLARLVDTENPRSYNYALLDHAHLVCLKKRAPLCHKCPIITYCCYGQASLRSS